ncbi:hypothetical protein H0X06_00465 [Candidatus Dependentiae bacterium]|nr:hypothetical protein [Candidatus Dependentiae bacterium]
MFIKKNIALLCPLLLISFSGFALPSSSSSPKISSSDTTTRRSADKAAKEVANSEAYYKSLAIRAEELINALNYNEAIPLVVTLLKETEGKDISQHTIIALDEAIGQAIAVEHTRIDWKKAKQEFKKLTTKKVNSYAQAQGHVWLGALRYLERGCIKNTEWAKNHFKKAISLKSNNRATAQAYLALGILCSFEQNSLVKKLFFNKKKFQKSTAKLRAQGLSYLKQAQSQTDSALVAVDATAALGSITHDIEQAFKDFQEITGMNSAIKKGTDAINSAKDSVKDTINSLSSAK